jgi:hypothetical protein
MCGQNVDLLNAKLVVRISIVTTRLVRVNRKRKVSVWCFTVEARFQSNTSPRRECECHSFASQYHFTSHGVPLTLDNYAN